MLDQGIDSGFLHFRGPFEIKVGLDEILFLFPEIASAQEQGLAVVRLHPEDSREEGVGFFRLTAGQGDTSSQGQQGQFVFQGQRLAELGLYAVEIVESFRIGTAVDEYVSHPDEPCHVEIASQLEGGLVGGEGKGRELQVVIEVTEQEVPPNVQFFEAPQGFQVDDGFQGFAQGNVGIGLGKPIEGLTGLLVDQLVEHGDCFRMSFGFEQTVDQAIMGVLSIGVAEDGGPIGVFGGGVLFQV